MSKPPFDQWLAYHSQAYPDVLDFLRKSPETVEHWRRAAQPFSAAELMRATDAIVEGEVEVYRASDHISVVCRIARSRRNSSARIGPRSIDGREIFRCHVCRDKGVVLVYHPRIPEQIRAGELAHEERPWLGAAKFNLACRCDSGDRWADGNDRSRALPRFNPDRFVAVGYDGNRESWERLVSFAMSQQKQALF